MRLAPFIVAQTEPILMAWEAFARTLSPGSKMSALALRDHAGDLLLATVRDMQSVGDRRDTPSVKGDLPGEELALRMDGASEEHAIGRLGQGFDLMQLVSEYRALRASVLSLWHRSHPGPHDADVEDVALFNASIDTSLATAVRCYTKRVDESRDMFLAILSHDLRNPLSSIAMLAQLMSLAKALDPAAHERAAMIHGSTKVMAKMIGDLLDYTRTRLGAGMPITRRATDLAEVALAVVEETSIAHPDVELSLKVQGDVRGDWDPDRLRQVFTNLIGNAIQHGERTLPITVTVEAGATSVWASIRNRGEIIPPAEMLRIFDPLVRGIGSATPREHRPGSIGLGLYIARELILAHGGTIDVTSSAADGTEFAFHLPRHADAVPDLQPGANLDITPEEPSAHAEAPVELV